MNVDLRGCFLYKDVIARALELEDSGDAVIGTDAEGIVLYWGASAEALYGWTESEALGRNVLDVTPAELSRTEAEGIMQRLRSGDLWSGEFIVHAKNGARFAVEVIDTPIRDTNGNLVGIVGTSRRTRYIDRV